MRAASKLLLSGVILAVASLGFAEGGSMNLPKTVEAGAAFSIPCAGNGQASLYIVGPAQVLKRDIQLGKPVAFAAGDLYNAGRYLAVLVDGSRTDTEEFDVVPASKPARLSFLAKPSRLPVNRRDGISGTVYVFDVYRNLITTPTPVSFELSSSSGGVQKSHAETREGVAWTQMNSTSAAGANTFAANVQGISSKRIVEQVPGEPCGLRMMAQTSGGQIALKTDPVRDCSGNPVPDGTIVTFTERYGNSETTADVPLKRGIAQVEMPAHPGARISVASGVTLGNEIVVR